MGVNDFYRDGKLRVVINESIMNSKDAVVCSFAHEVYEWNFLKRDLQGGIALTSEQLASKIGINSGVYHLEALRFEGDLLAILKTLY